MHITIRWHQVSGVPRVQYSEAYVSIQTGSCQWMGMDMEVWHGLGVADGLILRHKGHHGERLVFTYVKCTGRV